MEFSNNGGKKQVVTESIKNFDERSRWPFENPVVIFDQMGKPKNLFLLKNYNMKYNF